MLQHFHFFFVFFRVRINLIKSNGEKKIKLFTSIKRFDQVFSIQKITLFGGIVRSWVNT